MHENLTVKNADKIILTGASDRVISAAPGTIIVTGNGDDIIPLMGGNVAIEDRSTTDRIKLGGILGLYGGLHYTHSEADYASAFGGLFKYSYNSLGELKISSFFGDMWVLDYGTDQFVGRNKRKRIAPLQLKHARRSRDCGPMAQ